LRAEQQHQLQQQQADMHLREKQVAEEQHQLQQQQADGQDQLEYVRNFFEEHSKPSLMYKDVRCYYVRMTAGHQMTSKGGGGGGEVHALLAEHIANADAQDLAGVLDAGALDVRVDLDYATVQSWMVCPCKDGAKPRLACLQRVCDACQDRKVGVKAGCENVQLQYRQFKKLDNGQGVELTTVQTTLGELVADLNALMQKQLWHHCLAQHQRATFAHILNCKVALGRGRGVWYPLGTNLPSSKWSAMTCSVHR
ncbi:hypothetical protein QJQ45_014515, partial [Haematococcus lacustris]